jgi:hypothetical protein
LAEGGDADRDEGGQIGGMAAPYPALPMTQSQPAMRFIMVAARGMGGDQSLQHSGEARG